MKDPLSETILQEDTVYRGRLLHVTLAKVALPNGRTSKRDLVRHPGGVVVVAVTDDGQVYLERQFRTALGCVSTWPRAWPSRRQSAMRMNSSSCLPCRWKRPIKRR